MIINDLFNNKKQGIAEGWKTGATLGGLAGGLAGGPAGAVVGAGAGAIAGQLMKKKDPKTIPGYSENLTDATSYVLDHLPKTSYGELVMSARPQEMDKFDAIILNDLIPEFFIKKYGEEKGSYYLDKNPKLAKALYSEIQGLIRWIIPITITSKKFRDYKHNEVSAELGDDPKYLKYFGISQYDDWEDKQGMAEGKITLSTDPNWYGATVDNYQATGPVVNIPANQLVGFEPDDKMNQPKSKVNVEKIVAGLKQGAKLPPLLVRKYKNGYQVLDGHHRFWAYKLLGVKSIPAQIVPDSDIEEISKQGVAEGWKRDYRIKAQLSQAMAQANRFFDRDDPAKVAAADQTIAKREKGLARADARVKPYTPPAQDAEKMQRDLTAKYPNIDELVAAAEQRRDPNYDYAEGNAYYDGREAEQNYQKLKQIQRVIQGLNESLNRSHLP